METLVASRLRTLLSPTCTSHQLKASLTDDQIHAERHKNMMEHEGPSRLRLLRCRLWPARRWQPSGPSAGPCGCACAAPPSQRPMQFGCPCSTHTKHKHAICCLQG